MLVSSYAQKSSFISSSSTELNRPEFYFRPSKNFEISSFSSHYSPQLHGRITLWSYALKFINHWIQKKQKDIMNRSHVFLTSIIVVFVSMLFMYSGFLLALKISQKDTNEMLNSELVNHNADNVSYVPEFDPFTPYTVASTISQHSNIIAKQIQTQKHHKTSPSIRQRPSSLYNANHRARGTGPRFIRQHPAYQNVTKTRYVPNNPVTYVPTSNLNVRNSQRVRQLSQKNMTSSVPNHLFQNNSSSRYSRQNSPQSRKIMNRSNRHSAMKQTKTQRNATQRQSSSLRGLPKNSPLPQDYVPPVLQ